MARRGVISLDAIIKRTGVAKEQLDHPCDDEVLLEEITQHIVNYQQYGPRLEISGADISTFERDLRFAYSIKKITLEVFKLWHQRKKYDATYRVLAEVALKLGDGTGAEKICQICAEGVSKKGKEETDSERPSSGPPPVKDEVSHSTPTSHNQDATVEGPKQLQQYCTGEMDMPEQMEIGLSDATTAPASVRNRLMWDLSQFSRLKVHFLNPEVLQDRSWYCGKYPLSPVTIISWACTWNTHATHYPKFVDGLFEKDEADIRVKFDSKQGSWSRVGIAARKVTNTNEPTMVLNLRGLTAADQKSMVFHEFGHALGLDHEHQRSDFWDVLESKDEYGDLRFIIGRRRMQNGNNCKCLKACDAVFRSKADATGGVTNSKYDPDSIMHYWFDIRWLLPEYQKLGDIRTNRKLTPEEKAVLEGVHKRDHHNGRQALEPSQWDYVTLNAAYRSQTQAPVMDQGMDETDAMSIAPDPATPTARAQQKQQPPPVRGRGRGGRPRGGQNSPYTLPGPKKPGNASQSSNSSAGVDMQEPMESAPSSSNEPGAVQKLSPILQTLCKTHNLSSSDINKEVTDEHIVEIYQMVGNPVLVANHLHLSQDEIPAIDHSSGTDLNQKKLKTLQKWKENGELGKNATYFVLLEALISSKISNRAVKKLCELLEPEH